MMPLDSLNNQSKQEGQTSSEDRRQSDNRGLSLNSNLLMSPINPIDAFSGPVLNLSRDNQKDPPLQHQYHQPILETLFNVVDDNSKKGEVHSVFCVPDSVEVPVYISLYSQGNYNYEPSIEVGYERAQESNEIARSDEYVMTSEDYAQCNALQPLLQVFSSQPENEKSDSLELPSQLYNAPPAEVPQEGEVPELAEALQPATVPQLATGTTMLGMAFDTVLPADNAGGIIDGKIPVYPRTSKKPVARGTRKAHIKKRKSHEFAGDDPDKNAFCSTDDANSLPRDKEIGSDPIGVCKYTSTHPGCSEIQAPLLLPNTYLFLNEFNVPMLEFRYRGNQIAVRSDIENSTFPETRPFLFYNCVYPGALKPRHEYTGTRWNYERECNSIAWRIVGLNPHIYGKKGIIQKAVTSFRNTSLNPKHRSRSARSFARMKSLEERANIDFRYERQSVKTEMLGARDTSAEVASSETPNTETPSTETANAETANIGAAGAEIAGAEIAGAEIAGVEIAGAEIAGAEVPNPEVGAEGEEYVREQPEWNYDAYTPVQLPEQPHTAPLPQRGLRRGQPRAPSMPPMHIAQPQSIPRVQDDPWTPQLSPQAPQLTPLLQTHAASMPLMPQAPTQVVPHADGPPQLNSSTYPRYAGEQWYGSLR